jgi:hypothetical protein
MSSIGVTVHASFLEKVKNLKKFRIRIIRNGLRLVPRETYILAKQALQLKPE